MQSEHAVIDNDKCAECGVCVDECPNGAICEIELESEIEEKAADKQINISSEVMGLLGKPTLGTRLDEKRGESTGRQDTVFGMDRNRPRGMGRGIDRFNRGGRRGRRI